MPFKTLQGILSYKIFEIEFLLLLNCLKQLAIFGSFDELKIHQLGKTYYYSNVKNMLSISCKNAPKNGTNICDLGLRKCKRNITLDLMRSFLRVAKILLKKKQSPP